MIPDKKPEELKQLAKEIVSGTVFTDRNLPNLDLVGLVWLPISLGMFSSWSKEDLKEIGILYEDMSKAGRTVNGYPTFMSVQILNRGDAKKVSEAVKHLLQQNDPELDRIVKGA